MKIQVKVHTLRGGLFFLDDISACCEESDFIKIIREYEKSKVTTIFPLRSIERYDITETEDD